VKGVLVRALWIVAAFALVYWVLGAVRVLARPGLPRTVRLALAALLALAAGGFLQPGR